MLDFIRIACAVPKVTVGDVEKNAKDICAFMEKADAQSVDILLLPELALTGASCADLFFEDALHKAVKKGLRVARAGWNGKGMYVFLANGVEFFTEADISEFDDQDVEVSDRLVLRTAQETFQPGWLATQSDMLADDWYIVE